ncbi:V-type ATP synthase subunit D [Christensenellaceae bacterium OttesenSCG-928-M15]|nr:V-type ATP synthase subunit D [Christensenellaceae bacterium OttesenSCG-928-M15]
MEMTNLKKRRTTAVRGHKMMKDKRDEMVRRFIIYIRRNKELREEVEQKLSLAMQGFVLARATMGNEAVEEALMYPARSIEAKVGVQYELSIAVPKLELETGSSFAYPYGFATTSAELDGAVQALSELLPLLLELAQVEKTCKRLADEIEKTRRRVNALEYVMIPQFTEAIRQIRMKLEENERGNLTRLMKVKDMMAEAE